jgi:hypothetical protein
LPNHDSDGGGEAEFAFRTLRLGSVGHVEIEGLLQYVETRKRAEFSGALDRETKLTSV